MLQHDERIIKTALAGFVDSSAKGRPMLDIASLDLLKAPLQHLQEGFPSLPVWESTEKWGEVLMEVAERMRDNYPYPHPLYAGQMLKPPHAIARLAYTLALYFNPNNHALDGGRASSQMEKEAVAQLAAMFGWTDHLGHLTSGGTMANLEALWVAGQLKPQGKIVASDQAHYTHERISGVLGLPFHKLQAWDQLESLARNEELAVVVVTLGTTALGLLEPLDQVLALQERYGFRVHVDCAYGGYYRLADNLSQRGESLFALLDRVDSLVIDPHKHGMQPYGCGCVLFRDPSVGRFYRHDSPYTYFSSEELHLGEISLECSRPGASAVALWATQRLFPLVRGGEMAQFLQACRRAALALQERLEADSRWWAPFPPEIDIVVWAPRAATARQSSHFSRRLFQVCAQQGLHLALTQVGREQLPGLGLDWEGETTLTCLRSCLMKSQHEAWVETIWNLLQEALVVVLQEQE